MNHLTDLLDFDRYPLGDPSHPRYLSVRDAARAGLRSEGCAVIPGIVTAAGLAALSAEVADRKHLTHYSTSSMNPYFHTQRDPSWPDHHPMNTFIERSSGFIPGDAWDTGLAIDVIFRSELLAAFVADCLEEPRLHCYADPLAGLTANILDPGQQFAWHYDTNEFAVTLLVDAADEGGLFEYVPMSRTSDDEDFDRLQRILDGDRRDVRTLDLRPGDIQIFRGRHSVHRVTRVAPGSRPRHAAIFAYTAEPGVIGRLERTLQLFGRALPAHHDAEAARVRTDRLID